MSQDNKIMR